MSSLYLCGSLCLCISVYLCLSASASASGSGSASLPVCLSLSAPLSRTGVPGVGKTVQSAFIAAQHGVVHLVAKDVVAAARAQQTEVRDTERMTDIDSFHGHSGRGLRGESNEMMGTIDESLIIGDTHF